MEDNTPPLFKLLARTTKLFVGTDHTKRVVQVKTQTGLYIPPVSRLVLLQKAGHDNNIQESKITNDPMDKE